MVLSHALSCVHAQANEHDTNLDQPPATHHAARGRAVLARHARSRPPRRWDFRPCRALDAYLLPPVVPGAPAVATQRHLLPHARGSGTQRLSTEEGLTLRLLAKTLGATQSTLRRAFLQVTGLKPRELVEALRLHRFKALMRAGKSITDALYETGYGSSSRVYERSNAQLGMTPATYRKGGMGMKLAYTIAESPLGKVLVAATGRGVSAIYLGDEETRLVAELREEYPRAEIAAASNGFERWVKEVLQRIAGRPPHIELPLDLQATAFQRRVWTELQRIPRGSTRTYSQVARSLGRPKAVRAVARACARNPVSIVVPCHRVIREDGALAGYRWGLSRKEQLLASERSPSQSVRNGEEKGRARQFSQATAGTCGAP